LQPTTTTSTTSTTSTTPPSFQPGQPSLTQLPGNLPSLEPVTGPDNGVPRLRRRFDRPSNRETRYRANEILIESRLTREEVERLSGLTCSESVLVSLIQVWLHLCTGDGSIPVPDMVTNASPVPQFTGAQPNYLYALAQSDLPPVNTDQYAPQKMHLPEALRLATGNRVLIAVIDSEVDASHPDLAGAISANFETSKDAERPHSHGTGMAGAIAARRTMLGVAPGATLLTVRAFSTSAESAEGTTFNILKDLDWAAAQGARVEAWHQLHVPLVTTCAAGWAQTAPGRSKTDCDQRSFGGIAMMR
jgi:subtilisin family serine protease